MEKRPRRVYVNHGDDTACEVLSKAINAKLLIKALAPFSGGTYDLVTDICSDPGNIRARAKRQSPKGKSNASVAWTKLFAAGVRLSSIIEKMRGKNSKDIAKLTSQINSLCGKWEKTVKTRKNK